MCLSFYCSFVVSRFCLFLGSTFCSFGGIGSCLTNPFQAGSAIYTTLKIGPFIIFKNINVIRKKHQDGEYSIRAVKSALTSLEPTVIKPTTGWMALVRQCFPARFYLVEGMGKETLATIKINIPPASNYTHLLLLTAILPLQKQPSQIIAC